MKKCDFSEISDVLVYENVPISLGFSYTSKERGYDVVVGVLVSLEKFIANMPNITDMTPSKLVSVQTPTTQDLEIVDVFKDTTSIYHTLGMKKAPLHLLGLTWAN